MEKQYTITQFETMIHASLCTGIGACELAATWMGWENLFSCEIDEFCNRVLKYYYPNTVHYGNIFEQDFSGWKGKVDVLTAGFPCQPFSVAGKQLGAEDDRYLWPEVLRVIGEIKPTWFIGENVSGIRSVVLPGEEVEVGSYTDILGESYTFTEKHERYVLDRICEDLEAIGYSIQPVTIPACAVGAPHRRDRIWFIANRSDAGIKNVHEGEDCILSNRTITHPNNGQRLEPEEEIRTRRNSANTCDSVSTTHATSPGFQNGIRNEHGKDEPEDGTGMDNRLERPMRLRDASDTNSIRQKIRVQPTGDESKEREITYRYAPEPAVDYGRTLHPACWRNFPTQSPVCSRNDGISSRLSGLTFRDWREGCIKAYGNTMVPQVVLEIFKAIELVDKTFT